MRNNKRIDKVRHIIGSSALVSILEGLGVLDVYHDKLPIEKKKFCLTNTHV